MGIGENRGVVRGAGGSASVLHHGERANSHVQNGSLRAVTVPSCAEPFVSDVTDNMS